MIAGNRPANRPVDASLIDGDLSVASKCHCEQPSSEATKQSSPSTRLGALSLSKGWIATARPAGLAMTRHFEDTP